MFFIFVFSQACSGALVEPKFASGFDITTDALLKISGQGAVYVRLLDKHNIYESDTDSDCDDQLIQTTLNFCKFRIILPHCNYFNIILNTLTYY
jgi:hypothetical protein